MTTLPNPISTPTTERLKLNYTLRADGVAAGSSRRRTKACCSKRLARTHALLRTAAMASVSAIASAIAIHNEATNDELRVQGFGKLQYQLFIPGLTRPRVLYPVGVYVQRNCRTNDHSPIMSTFVSNISSTSYYGVSSSCGEQAAQGPHAPRCWEKKSARKYR